MIVSVLSHLRNSLLWSLRRPAVWLGIALAAAASAGLILDSPESNGRLWPYVWLAGVTEPMKSPAWVDIDRQPALIWRAVDADAPLSMTPFDSPESKQPLIDYPGVDPQIWWAVRASADSFHLVWRQPDGAYHNALIASDGRTLRGPIDLPGRAKSDAILLPQTRGHAALLWHDPDSAQVVTVDLDQEGRPGPVRTLPFRHVARFSAAVDRHDRLHAAWLSAQEPDVWTVRYQFDPTADEGQPSAAELHTFSTQPGESIVAFALGLDDTHGYVAWSITNAAQPDVETVFVLPFSLGLLSANTPIELRVPSKVRDDAVDSPYGRLYRLAPDTAPFAALRWPVIASSQHSISPLVVAARLDDGWRPAVVYFQAGRLLGFQVIASHPANAGPPALAFDAEGKLYVAWPGLRRTATILHVASSKRH